MGSWIQHQHCFLCSVSFFLVTYRKTKHLCSMVSFFISLHLLLSLNSEQWKIHLIKNKRVKTYNFLYGKNTDVLLLSFSLSLTDRCGLRLPWSQVCCYLPAYVHSLGVPAEAGRFTFTLIFFYSTAVSWWLMKAVHCVNDKLSCAYSYCVTCECVTHKVLHLVQCLD